VRAVPEGRLALPDELNSSTAARPSPEYLEVTDPEGHTSRVPLRGERLVIGRTGDADIRLDADGVSRRHAELVRDPFSRWWIRDSGSRHGTFLAGAHVSEQLLRLGDVVEIDRFRLAMCCDGALASVRAALPASTVAVSGSPDEKVRSLSHLQAPVLSAANLRLVAFLGRQLISIESAEERLRVLCGLMVDHSFRGRWAACVRVRKDRPEGPPELLCEPAVNSEGPPVEPYFSRGLLRTVLARDEAVLASNVPAGLVDVELTMPASRQAMAALACPLRSDAQVMDILYVILPPECGTSEWLALASLAADGFGRAELAWASSRQAQAYALIEAELAQAAEIQRGLVPGGVRVAGLDLALRFAPCRWVGGDYVDVVPMPDGRVLLAIGDVCGKGLQAALVAVSVHSMIHAAVGGGVGPARLMEILDDYLAKHLPPGAFVTLLAMAVDSATGNLEIVNAGHPPPVLVDGQGHIRWMEMAANVPLGLGRAPFMPQAGRIGRGELLAMFTDGVTDIRVGPEERLGLGWVGERVSAFCAGRGALRAEEVASRLAAEIDRHLVGGMAEDDRTFLLVRCL